MSQIIEPKAADPARVVLPRTLSVALAAACTMQMEGHRWSAQNVAAASTVLTGGGAQMLLSALAGRLDRSDPSSAGWALLALPATLGNAELQVVAAIVLAALGRSFNSIRQGGGRLWIGEETTAVKDPASFGGTGVGPAH
ncbi:hypothetical protein [Streptomyces sanglieri]|uniref:hypothetical protein n=1 Tax=Streptomyces sanglieri TaxID=193460 RepID=UPI0035260A81